MDIDAGTSSTQAPMPVTAQAGQAARNVPQIDFDAIASVLDEESQLREQIRERTRMLESAVRSAQSSLDGIHVAKEEDVNDIVQRTEACFPEIAASLANIARIIPEWHFYKYNDMFSRTLQSAVYCIVFVGWLKDDRLTTKDQVISILDIESLGKEHFQLPTEDYLHGLISLISELSRLAMNSVTGGSYAMPLRISRFCKDLSAGFSLLNLKNDSLRRRFDAIKYDVQKIEGIVYDISLRGLVKAEDVEEHRVGVKRPRPSSTIDAKVKAE